jgi:hypothetical protein
MFHARGDIAVNAREICPVEFTERFRMGIRFFQKSALLFGLEHYVHFHNQLYQRAIL